MVVSATDDPFSTNFILFLTGFLPVILRHNIEKKTFPLE